MKRLAAILICLASLASLPSLHAQAFSFSDPAHRTLPSTGPDLTSLAWDLLAWWKLDDNTGTAFVDSSTNSLADGTLQGGYAWTNDSKFGKAVVFDGVDGLAFNTDTATLCISNNFTVALWIKQTATGQSSVYAMAKRAAGDDFSIIYGFNPNVYEFYADSVATGDVPYTNIGVTTTDTAWHHICWTYNGSNLKGYYDGTLTTNLPIVFELNHQVDSQLLFPSSGANNMAAIVDDIRIYRRAITQIEVTGLQTNP